MKDRLQKVDVVRRNTHVYSEKKTKKSHYSYRLSETIYFMSFSYSFLPSFNINHIICVIYFFWRIYSIYLHTCIYVDNIVIRNCVCVFVMMLKEKKTARGRLAYNMSTSRYFFCDVCLYTFSIHFTTCSVIVHKAMRWDLLLFSLSRSMYSRTLLRATSFQFSLPFSRISISSFVLWLLACNITWQEDIRERMNNMRAIC